MSKHSQLSPTHNKMHPIIRHRQKSHFTNQPDQYQVHEIDHNLGPKNSLNIDDCQKFVT